MFRRAKIIVCALSAMAVSPYSTAEESSKALAEKSALMWSAFECSALAGRSNYKEEAERLFNVGYGQGSEFIDALKKNKIQQKDLDENMPMILISLIGGPSNDFMLGRIYESAQNSARESFVQKDPASDSMELQRTKAEIEFQKRNCKFIGAKSSVVR